MVNKVLEIMKTENFNIFFSFVLGLGIVAMLRPICKGNACAINKAPPVKDWDGAVYRLGADCYEYKAVPVQCPPEGSQDIYESFKSMNNARSKQRDSNLSE
jgi:hypothetical protein